MRRAAVLAFLLFALPCLASRVPAGAAAEVAALDAGGQVYAAACSLETWRGFVRDVARVTTAETAPAIITISHLYLCGTTARSARDLRGVAGNASGIESRRGRAWAPSVTVGDDGIARVSFRTGEACFGELAMAATARGWRVTGVSESCG